MKRKKKKLNIWRDIWAVFIVFVSVWVLVVAVSVGVFVRDSIMNQGYNH